MGSQRQDMRLVVASRKPLVELESEFSGLDDRAVATSLEVSLAWCRNIHALLGFDEPDT